MKKTTFYVDYFYEVGSDEFGCKLCRLDRFDMALSNDEYEDLYNVRESHNEELNSWHTVRF